MIALSLSCACAKRGAPIRLITNSSVDKVRQYLIIVVPNVTVSITSGTQIHFAISVRVRIESRPTLNVCFGYKRIFR